MQLPFNSKVRGLGVLGDNVQKHQDSGSDFQRVHIEGKPALGAIFHINVRANVIIWHRFPLDLLHRPSKLCHHVELKGESAFGEVGTNLVLLEDINRRGLRLLLDSFPAVLRLRAAHK